MALVAGLGFSVMLFLAVTEPAQGRLRSLFIPFHLRHRGVPGSLHVVMINGCRRHRRRGRPYLRPLACALQIAFHVALGYSDEQQGSEGNADYY